MMSKKISPILRTTFLIIFLAIISGCTRSIVFDFIDEYTQFPVTVTTKDGKQYRLWKNWQADSLKNITGTGINLDSKDSLKSFQGTILSSEIEKVQYEDDLTPAYLGIIGVSIMFAFLAFYKR